jgi:uncharacterized membrane protein
MIKKKNSEKVISKEDPKVFAFLATFLSIFGFLIAIIAKKEDKYIMFYAKQSLVIFIIAVIASAINSILIWIPILGWLIAGLINLAVCILWILGWVYALSGEQKDVPIVGEYAKKLNL